MKKITALCLSILSASSYAADATCPTSFYDADGYGYNTDVFQNPAVTTGNIVIDATFLYEAGDDMLLTKPEVFVEDATRAHHEPIFNYTYSDNSVSAGETFSLHLEVDRASFNSLTENGSVLFYRLNSVPNGQLLATFYPLEDVPTIQCN